MILLLAKINYLFLLFFVWLSIREKFIFSFPKSKNKFCRFGFFLFLVRCAAMAWKGKLLLRKCTFCEINNWRIQTALKRCYFSIAYIRIVAQYFLPNYWYFLNFFYHIAIQMSLERMYQPIWNVVNFEIPNGFRYSTMVRIHLWI